ncbi:MAG: hypothetical protein LZ167_05940 [Thaumarchaeota archaeon]|jgi:hypothetical protein|nr:hypothetical protein [Candidatus Geocrenenecus arthurdayi]MCL7396935.1 hypothetical protein [Candidatus Geocrenenecus arthurdayi]
MNLTLEPYIPEQIIDYFQSISNLTARLLGRYLVYIGRRTIVIVGYPVSGEYREEDIVKIVQESLQGGMEDIIVIAPRLPPCLRFEEVRIDDYYRLTLPVKEVGKKLRYMISRASRELTVEVDKKLTKSHKRIMMDFLKRPDVEKYMEYVCSRLDYYLSRSNTVRTINAFRKDGVLAGFNVIDLPSGDYSFYMFNFIDRTEGYVPGVSDLLLYNSLRISYDEGKRYVNMGLGINEGTKRFKIKWGATPFLPYQYGVIKQASIYEAFDIFSKL